MSQTSLAGVGSLGAPAAHPARGPCRPPEVAPMAYRLSRSPQVGFTGGLPGPAEQPRPDHIATKETDHGIDDASGGQRPAAANAR
jgi:hypothetical protein